MTSDGTVLVSHPRRHRYCSKGYVLRGDFSSSIQAKNCWYTHRSSGCPRLSPLRPSTRVHTGAPASPLPGLTTPANFYTPCSLHNLHNSRVRRASGFLLTAFSNATPHTFF